MMAVKNKRKKEKGKKLKIENDRKSAQISIYQQIEALMN